MANRQHVIRLYAQNFKNVKVLDIVPNRYITRVSGANGAGKTSTLDAIFYALLPRKTLSPELIRKGERTGEIRVETNSHIITRKLDAEGGSLEILVKDSNTLVKDTVGWLEDLVGDLGFDPLRFMKLKPEEQFDVLKALVPMEADIDALEQANSEAIDTITERKAENRRLRATLENIPFNETMPAKPIDVDALLAESREVTEHNARIEDERRGRDTITEQRNALIRSMETRTQRINELKAELQRLEDENATNSTTLGNANAEMAKWEPLPQRKDPSAVTEKISQAITVNALIATNNAARQQRENFTAQVATHDKQIEQLQAEVRDRKVAIGLALKRAKFPIPGLSFETREEGSNGRERKNPKKVVTYKGVPLADASTGEQIRVSAAIGMAGKLDLRFLLIREGSLLDDEGMAILEKMAHENDCQIVMELVDTSGKVGVFMQEGEVKTVNAEPEPEPEPVAARARAARQPRTRKPKDSQGKD